MPRRKTQRFVPGLSIQVHRCPICKAETTMPFLAQESGWTGKALKYEGACYDCVRPELDRRRALQAKQEAAAP